YERFLETAMGELGFRCEENSHHGACLRVRDGLTGFTQEHDTQHWRGFYPYSWNPWAYGALQVHPAPAPQLEPPGIVLRVRHRAGQQHGRPELRRHPSPFGHTVRGETPGHGPHAVRDGTGKAEEPGGEGMQMDGVAVPGGGTVPPPDVRGDPGSSGAPS